MSHARRLEPTASQSPGAMPRLAPAAILTIGLLAWGLLPDELASGTPLALRDVLRNDLPNRADYERIELGYYEHLLDAAPNTPAPAAGEAAIGPVAGDDRLTVKVADVREFVLRPNLARQPDAGIPWSTNAEGMRDRAYPRVKPPNTFRVALAGDSIGAGWGVGDDEGFEPLLERAWNDRARAAGGPAVEMLNLAVPGHGPGQRWTQLETIGWDYEPDLVVFEATEADAGWDERRLRSALARGIGFDAAVYRDVLARAGVRPGRDTASYRRLLKPLRWELLEGVYRSAVASCRSRGLPVVWVLIPRVGRPIEPADHRRLLETARRAGFDAVIDVSSAYDGEDARALAVGPNDYHPNAQGHARLARALDAALASLPALERLSPPRRKNAEASR